VGIELNSLHCPDEAAVDRKRFNDVKHVFSFPGTDKVSRGGVEDCRWP
jgi:hypothetical protein